MSDPVVEATQKAWNTTAYVSELNGNVLNPYGLAKTAAREVLEPIRELHKPAWGNCMLACCSGAECRNPTRVCGHDYDDWPCDTAKLIYTTEELDDPFG